MLKIYDCDLTEFKDNICNKSLYIFGAGNKAKLDYIEWSLQDKTIAVVDNDVKLQNKPWKYDNKIFVISKEKMILDMRNKGVKNCALLITPSFYSIDIIRDLDQEEELSYLETYVSCLISECYLPQNFSFTDGNSRIPKIIHYCWFGEKAIPNGMKRYIDSWRRFCPDYEIVRWDESNYDITKNEYMYEAYQEKKWGFVPDYARLDIVYNYGGVYLDTDVEMICGFDDLLCDNSFFSADFAGAVNLGSGFGSIPRNPLIEEMRDVYKNKHFVNDDGTINLEPCQHYQNPILRRYGFDIYPKYQNIKGNVIYPAEVLAPIGIYTGRKYFTNKTHSIHHINLSWCKSEERKKRNQFKSEIEQRLKMPC